MESLLPFLIVCPLTFIGGFIDAIAGGGGLITLPAYMLAGLPAHLAIGTNKLSSALGTTIATGRFAAKGYIKLYPALICIVAAMIGSSIGSRLTLLVSEELLGKILVAVLFMVAFYVLRSRDLAKDENEHEDTFDKKTCIRMGAAALGIGCYDGLYGPGTGTFLILALNGWAHLNLRNSAGLTKAANLSSNLSALATFILAGNVDYRLGIAGAICNIIGNYLGAGAFFANAGKIVKPAIITVLTLLLLKILFG